MRRRIIKQGHNTLTITIPSKWAKEFNLSAGDEIEISELNNGLFVSTEKKDGVRKAVINISEMDIPTIWKYFMAVYREGYDELKVEFDPDQIHESPYKHFDSHAIDIKYGKKSRQHKPTETIQEIANRFVGFEVIEHHKDYCIIKDLSESSAKEFESSLRRVYLLILQMGEEVTEAIKTNNPSLVSHTHDIDINVDKFHDYCIRVLNKKGYANAKKTNLIFSYLFLLEILGDEFKNIARHITEDMKGKKLTNLLPLAEVTLEQLNKIYDLYYNFTKNKVIEMSKRDMEIYFYLPKIYKKKPGKKSELSDDELEILNHFRRIGRYINSLTELRIEMEY
jgi:phosphate uptake regulator